MTQVNNNKYIEFFKLILMLIYVIVGNLRNSTINFDKFFQIIQLFSLALLTLTCIYEFLLGKIILYLKDIIFILFSVLTIFTSKHTFVFGFAVFYYSFININKKKTVLYLNISIICTFIFIIFLAFFGAIENIITYRSDGTLRYQMGFLTSTLPNSILLFTFLNFIYVYQEKTKFALIFLYNFVSLYFYLKTGTRTGFILIFITSLLVIMFKISEFRRIIIYFNSKKLFQKIFILFPIIFFLGEIYLIYLYSKFTPLSFKLNRLFSTRLSNTLSLYNEFGFKLLGQNIPSTISGEYIGSDICYFYYLINYGLIFLLLTMYLQIKQIKKAIDEKQILILICILILIIDGFVEPYLLDYKYHFFAFVYPLQFDKKINKKRENLIWKK